MPFASPSAARPADGVPLSVRLLVIDDDDVDRERVLRLLARTTLAVDAKQADSSASALHLLRAHDFDCIMLDNQLGDASGTDLLPQIQRESRRPCPVIMITGAGNESLAVRALQRGAADYLTKYQLDADLLVRAIRRAMEHQRMQAELDELHQRMEQRVQEQAAAILQSERDLRAILDHTPTAIGYWSADLVNRFGNRAHGRWLGVDPETLPGRRLVDVIGAAGLARERHHIDAVLRGESQSFEQTDLAPDGVTRRHAQRSFHADVDDDGRVLGFYATLNDVSDIKQAQARAEELASFAQTLFDHSPVGLGVFDDRLQCLQCNRALGELVGAPEPQVQGMSLGSLAGDGLEALRMTGLATLADGLPRHLDLDTVTVFGLRLQATCAWARVDREGRAQLLLAAQDSAEQWRARDALVTARNAAEEAARSKSRFLANMSHEIRTPMNAVIGLTRLALDDELSELARDFIQKAHAAAVALMGLLDDVLDYSKIEAGQLSLESVPLELEQVLQRVVDLFAAHIEQKGLALRVDLAPDVPRWVLGDALRLGQVLNNLVGNAVKFTERGHIGISVRRLDATDTAPAMLRFAVRDSGIGIAPEQHEALFEAFSQADNSITRRFGGTGLGLSICRRLVAQMQGSIGVDSRPGAGSEFWFNARLDAVPTPSVDGSGTDDEPLRLLLIEPRADEASPLLHSLPGRQVAVHTVSDAAGAARALAQATAQRRPFDGVLLHWNGHHAAPGAQTAPTSVIPMLRQAAGADAALVVLGQVSVVGRSTASAPGSDALPDALLTRPVLPSALRAALLRARQARSAPAAVLPAATVSQAAPALPLAGLQVLLVEDNAINQMVAQFTLERLGAEVTRADDGEEALALLQGSGADRFSVILMDMHMPRMDGLEATRRICADPRTRHLPVVGMTAAALPEDRAQCLQAGMVGHLTKPIAIDALLGALRRWAPRSPQTMAPAATGDLPGFDLRPLARLMRGNPQAVPRLMRRFAEQEAHAVTEVQTLLDRGELLQAARRLHKLRGGAAALGAQAVAQATQEAEDALRLHEPWADALAAVDRSLQAALLAIQARFGREGS